MTARARRVIVTVAVVLALAAVSWPLNVLDVRARAPFASVASAFDAPPGYPGYGWSRDGRAVGEFELTTIAGPSHCGWQSATMVFIAWPPGTVATTGKVDVNVARERGAEVGEKVAVAAEKMKETAAEAALTSKIKAKMVLDDYVKARAIDVTTNGSTVTVSGTVSSVSEHDRALRLARETAGVTQVIDHLTVETR